MEYQGQSIPDAAQEVFEDSTGKMAWQIAQLLSGIGAWLDWAKLFMSNKAWTVVQLVFGCFLVIVAAARLAAHRGLKHRYEDYNQIIEGRKKRLIEGK